MVMLVAPNPLSQVHHSNNEPLYSPYLIFNDNQSTTQIPALI